MQNIDALRKTIPEPAKDLKLNLQSILKESSLKQDQVWGCALAAVNFIKDAKLREALLADAKADGVPDAVVEDAQAAAALMGMTTVYYRFRHLVGKEDYTQRPARLRMMRMARPATSKAEFELFSLACAVLAGCEMCIKSHEANILQHGLTEDQVHDAARIAAVINGGSIALSL